MRFETRKWKVQDETRGRRVSEKNDLTQTRTWQLCGAFSIAEPEPEYLVDSGETESPTTNYAEHIDDVLYKGT